MILNISDIWLRLRVVIVNFSVNLYPQVYTAGQKLPTFWLIFQKAWSKGYFRLLFCKVSLQKGHSVAENIHMNIVLINFNFLLELSLLICPKNDINLFWYIT